MPSWCITPRPSTSTQGDVDGHAGSSTSSLRGVLVDMDGLLVDSEPLWFEVERDVFARLGGPWAWTRADADALVGGSVAASAARIAELAGQASAAEQAEEWIVDGMAQRLGTGVPLKPGASALLAACAEHGVPTALVSSSYRRLVDVVLAGMPSGTFAASVAGDEVQQGKPSPEPYLMALTLLGLPAADCVVLEDSPTGATAGHAAGCAVVVVPDLAPLPASHPWTVVTSLELLDVAALERVVTR